MTNFLSALMIVTLYTNESRIHTSPAGDAIACRRVTEQVYTAWWNENGTNHSLEIKRVPIATNHVLLLQSWTEGPMKVERVPLGVRDVITPPKPTR